MLFILINFLIEGTHYFSYSKYLFMVLPQNIVDLFAISLSYICKRD